jgi:osmotically-inducible protein OsmY
MPYFYAPYPPPPHQYRYYAPLYGPCAAQAPPSDTELADEIKNKLVWDPWVDANRVQVEVNQGVVTLTGNVPSIFEKRAAGDDAWDTPGTLDVHNDLMITPS